MHSDRPHGSLLEGLASLGAKGAEVWIYRGTGPMAQKVVSNDLRVHGQERNYYSGASKNKATAHVSK